MKILKFNGVVAEKSKDGRFIYRYFDEPITKDGGNLVIIPVTIPSGVVEQEHYHEKVNEFIFFLTKGISRVNGKDYDMHPYDILILDTRERHQIIAKDQDVKVLVIKKGIVDKVNC
mgnify:CR=1 FL=1